jgi:pyruvate formate lyase activating enzyme
MLLGGLQRMTLIDYPGKVAATVFTVGCNFRCSFCHNPELVLKSEFLVLPGDNTLEKEFFEFLKTRHGKLDGVCITGGEPTVQPDLIEFITKIKKLGFVVKLDSNGTRPDILRKLFDKKLLDYVAMDIKSSLDNYRNTCGTDIDLERIKLSVELIRNSGVDYEFRTTVVPGVHTVKEFEDVAEWLKGSRKYILQKYEDNGKILDKTLTERIRGKEVDLEEIKKIMETTIEDVSVRS